MRRQSSRSLSDLRYAPGALARKRTRESAHELPAASVVAAALLAASGAIFWVLTREKKRERRQGPAVDLLQGPHKRVPD